MNLKDFVAVSGLPGLYRLAATRANGLLIQEMDSDKTRFASTRKHQFTPLESVAIYTDSDSTELAEIFKRIKDNLPDLPTPESNASKEQFFDYFSEILPDYDEERVLISDIKKVIKWFNFLNERALLEEAVAEKEVEQVEKKKDTRSKQKKKSTQSAKAEKKKE